MTLIVDSTLKVSLILCAGLALTSLLRGRSASARHWILAMTIVSAAAVPLVEPWLPAWSASGLPAHRFAPAATPSVSAAAAATVDVRTSMEIAHLGAAPAPAAAPRPLRRVIGASALIGSVASLLVLVVGFLRLAWLARRAQPIVEGPWVEHAREVAREYGLRRRIRLLQGEHPSLLVTWGAIRPRLIVPRAALAWSDDRIRVVLRHELAHIRRGDWLVQLAGEVVRAVYWFNPLVWIACTRMRDERERACDDAVLRAVDAPEYATHLIALARALKAESTPRVPAPSVVQPSSLERRIKAMLDVTLARTPATRTLRFTTAAAMVALTMGIAAAQTGRSVLSGSVLDAMGAPVPGVTVTLVNEHSRARYEVATDESGRYEFVPLPADNYLLLAAFPAFSTVKDVVALSGRTVRRDIALALGELREQVSVRGKNVFRLENGDVVGPDGDRARFKVFEIRPEESDSPGVPGQGFAMSARGQIVTELTRSATFAPPTTDACAPSAIGGRVRTPARIKYVRPIYPEQVGDSTVYGEVELSGVIASDGTVKDLRITKTVQSDLDASAIEAVSQWRFESPLLNCRPVDVPFTVKVDFGIQ